MLPFSLLLDLHVKTRDQCGRRSGVNGTPTFFLNNMRLADDDRLEQSVLRAP